MYRCISCVIFLWVTSDGVGIYYRYVLTRGWLLRVDMNLRRLLNGYEGPCSMQVDTRKFGLTKGMSGSAWKRGSSGAQRHR